MSDQNDEGSPAVRVDIPSAARIYDYGLGGNDNFEVDRQAAIAGGQQFPETMDAARENRLFLYRVVRFLARDLGVRQFLDMGSGLPTQNNVHDVAQQFQPDAQVVYVDNDPIVLSHGRALLAKDDSTTVIAADMTEPDKILSDPDTTRLIDFSEPVAVLFLSVGHSIVDDTKVSNMLTTVQDTIATGSYIAFTQMVATSQAAADELNQAARGVNLEWKTRLASDVSGFLDGLEPIEPGLLNVAEWRPDPEQPPLAPVHEELKPFLGASTKSQRCYEFGGLLSTHPGATVT